MQQEMQIQILRESLTAAFLVLQEVYGYVRMDAHTLRKVTNAIEDAERALQQTD